MARRRLVRLPLLVLLAVLLWTTASSVALSGAPLHHAGLIVRHGDGRLTYAYIAFPEETISGIEVLRRSGIPLVTISFGGLGEAVCSLGDEGCPAHECRKRVCQGSGQDAPYWQVFRQTKPGEWRPLMLGASATKVHDGDIDGWSWTGREAQLPAATLADIARITGADASGAPFGTPPGPSAISRDIVPPGAKPRPPERRQGRSTYIAAAALITTIGLIALVFARRGPRATFGAPR